MRRRGLDATERCAETPFSPWLAQRLILRVLAAWVVVVSARQVGKTHVAAYRTLRTAYEKPGSVSVVMAPTKQFLRRAIDKLRELADGLPGVEWVEGRSRFELSNGSVIECVSAESADGESVRGLKINGLLWPDEAALIPERAINAARGCLLVGRGHVLITTTPVGRNWVYREYSKTSDRQVARFRFRAADSPFTDAAELARCRQDYVPEKAAQELDAVFVDELVLPFPNTSRLFVARFPDRPAQSKASLRNVIGVDLGERVDWTVLTLMNCWGEARLLGRWQRREWFDSVADIALHAREHDALVVADHGMGSGAGTPLKAELERLGVRVALVSTAQLGMKKRMVEQTRLDVQWERIHVLRDGTCEALAEQLRHELTVFQAVTRAIRGVEHVVYEAPSLRGEHDDCVISLCLACWGRAHLGGPADDEPDISLDQLVDFNRRMGEHLNRPGLGGLWVDAGGQS